MKASASQAQSKRAHENAPTTNLLCTYSTASKLRMLNTGTRHFPVDSTQHPDSFVSIASQQNGTDLN